MGGPVNPSVSPGIEGFIVTFLIACSLFLLMRNMSTRLRNLRYREEAEEERRQTQAGAETRPSAVGEKVPDESAASDDAQSEPDEPPVRVDSAPTEVDQTPADPAAPPAATSETDEKPDHPHDRTARER